jgi:hypothetical protein
VNKKRFENSKVKIEDSMKIVDLIYENFIKKKKKKKKKKLIFSDSFAIDSQSNSIQTLCKLYVNSMQTLCKLYANSMQPFNNE